MKLNMPIAICSTSSVARKECEIGARDLGNDEKCESWSKSQAISRKAADYSIEI